MTAPAAHKPAPDAGTAGADWQAKLWGAQIAVNMPSPDALLEDLGKLMAQGDGFQVATLNLDHVVKLRRDPAFAAAYERHSHVTADGNPIVWLLRLAGQKVTLTPGSELVAPVAALAAENSVPVGLFGSDQASLTAAAEALRGLAPDLNVASCLSPPMGFDPTSAEADALLEDVAASGARVIFLALGAPKQEVLAARIATRHPQMGTLSIGAGLDFLSGRQTRAPRLVRALALEWLWRLLKSPARLWRRYGKCLLVLPDLTLRAVRLRGTFSG